MGTYTCYLQDLSHHNTKIQFSTETSLGPNNQGSTEMFPKCIIVYCRDTLGAERQKKVPEFVPVSILLLPIPMWHFQKCIYLYILTTNVANLGIIFLIFPFCVCMHCNATRCIFLLSCHGPRQHQNSDLHAGGSLIETSETTLNEKIL